MCSPVGEMSREPSKLDVAVAIVVAAAHRAAAYEASRWLIDTLKQRVPIWKKEWFDDGAHWVSPTP